MSRLCLGFLYSVAETATCVDRCYQAVKIYTYADPFIVAQQYHEKWALWKDQYDNNYTDGLFNLQLHFPRLIHCNLQFETMKVLGINRFHITLKYHHKAAFWCKYIYSNIVTFVQEDGRDFESLERPGQDLNLQPVKWLVIEITTPPSHPQKGI